MDSSDSREALHGPITPTFIKYLVPSLVGILAMTSASLIDGIFIGNYVGATALAVVNLIIPFLSLVFGAGMMLSIGGSVRAGKYLGQNNVEAASAIFSKCLIAILTYSLIVVGLGLTFHQQIYIGLGAKADLFPMMNQYFIPILPFLIAQLGTVLLYFFIRLDGFPNLAATSLVIGSVFNIGLDYLFISVFGWGLQGAALATGVSQVLPFLVLLSYFLLPKRQLTFRFRQNHWKELFQASYNGISDFINEVSAGIVAFTFNWLLMIRAGVEGVAAITVVNYLLMMGLMIFFSIADAQQVMMSQNFGAKRPERMHGILRVAGTMGAVVGFFCVLALVFFDRPLINMFLNAREPISTANLAAEFILYIWPVFIVLGLNVVLTSYLTFIHRPFESGVIAVSRSLILPCGLLLALYWVFDGYQFALALPLAEGLSFLLAWYYYQRFNPEAVTQ